MILTKIYENKSPVSLRGKRRKVNEGVLMVHLGQLWPPSKEEEYKNLRIGDQNNV